MYADFGQGTTGGGWGTSDPSAWHQLAFTYDPQTDTFTAYGDGAVQQSYKDGPLSPNTFDSIGGALIGRQARNVQGDNYAPFTGDVANVSVYNYVLSPAQISAHYAAAVGR
jgi:hypothetical protein